MTLLREKIVSNINTYLKSSGDTNILARVLLREHIKSTSGLQREVHRGLHNVRVHENRRWVIKIQKREREMDRQTEVMCTFTVKKPFLSLTVEVKKVF